MKDRMARTAIESAVQDGRLRPGGTVVEYTSGTTGISLAFVCAVLGLDLHIVFSDAFSQEKRRTMLAFGATVEEIHSDGGAITESLVKAMIARAAEVASQRIGRALGGTERRQPNRGHRDRVRTAALGPCDTCRPACIAPLVSEAGKPYHSLVVAIE